MAGETFTYRTAGGLGVIRDCEAVEAAAAIEEIVGALDQRAGVLLTSSYEYPGRYTRWDIGFSDPPLRLSSRDYFFELRALNERGCILLSHLRDVLVTLDFLRLGDCNKDSVSGELIRNNETFNEEERSKQISIFSLLRALNGIFASTLDHRLGWYGAFGYDLVFQFETMQKKLARPDSRRDLLLYLPDQITVVDHSAKQALRYSYDFELPRGTTQGLKRQTAVRNYRGVKELQKRRDHAPGEYAGVAKSAYDYFKRGDLFEVVPGQCFFEPSPASPAQIFRRLQKNNPSPYGFLINLGEDEYLVGASPEMYLRSDGRRIETCPISGTIARGNDPIADAEQILKLLSSEKEASELTMCTDVDRNDKARVCVPGSVRVLGRRQIEMYSRLIHTVDHVEGHLREGYDALDAFLSHMWAVTVTGAPKLWAMRFIEEHERSYRAWYGGAVGAVLFDGNVNTGLTLRTIRVKEGVAEVRVGATLLIDADPEAEEKETELKASALLEAIAQAGRDPAAKLSATAAKVGTGRRVLLVDHEDSFVNMLADYLRQTGAAVSTVRAGFNALQWQNYFARNNIDLLVLSPGPGCPRDFEIATTIAAALAAKIPIFGVCLGLQGLVEYFGGELAVLEHPMHGKTSLIQVIDGRLFAGFPAEFKAGRYHSLYALKEKLPHELKVTAETQDGVIMAIEHVSLPVAAVQFHPESIMTLQDGLGQKLIHNVIVGSAA